MKRRSNDRGGWPGAGPIDRAEHELSTWERQTDALSRVLSSPDKKIMRTDEMRQAIESIEPDQYEKLGYYERWITAFETIMINKGILTREEIDAKVAELDTGGG